MLYLIGTGLNPKQLTLEALEAIKGCDRIFLEAYTSQYSQGHASDLKEIIGKEFLELGRKGVEEEFESALLSARKNNIALLVYGNPLTATTHIQLLLDAKSSGVKTKVIPGISITNYLAEAGLDEYKFGRTVTICYSSEGYEPESFFDQILKNQRIGLHTLCLLDIKKGGKQEMLMDCAEAIEILEKIAQKRKDNAKKTEFRYVALVGMGSEEQKIIIGTKKILESKEVKRFYPQSLIVLGKTNEKEEEALASLHS